MIIKKNIFLTFTFIFLLNNVSYADVLSMEAVVNTQSLNIRKAADGKSDIVTSVRKDTKLNILSISDDNLWYKVSTKTKLGWVDKKFVNTNVIGNPNYKLVSTIGGTIESSILSNSIKSTFNSNYRYILNFSDRYNLKIYDKNNRFINSIEFSYTWVTEKKDLDNIVLAVDDENNIYTNNNDKNVITKYDSKGLKILNINSLSLRDF